MERVLAVAVNTFREAVRDRVLLGVLIAASAVLLFTLALAQLSLNQSERIVLDLGLASISLFSVVVATFLGSSLLYKEIEKKTLYVILPKPIHRWEFLVGKFFGIVLTALVFIATMGATQLLVASVQGGAPVVGVLGLGSLAAAVLGLAIWRLHDASRLLLPWAIGACAAAGTLAAGVGVDVAVVVASLLLVVGEVMVLAAVAMLFSSFSTPFLTGLLTLGVWLVGRSADEMASMQSDVIPPEVKSLLRFLAEVVPNFHLFVPGRNTLVSDAGAGPWGYVATTLGYGLAYTALLLVFAALIFRRRDFL